MSATVNLSGSAAAPLMGWADTWQPPEVSTTAGNVDDELKNKAREIEIEAETKMMIFGLRVTLNAMSTQIGHQARTISQNTGGEKETIQPGSLGKKLDLYL